MSSVVYFVVAIVVGVALWKMRREMGAAKIFSAALFWPFAAVFALLYVYVLGGRKARGIITRGVGSGSGVTRIDEDDTYHASDPGVRSPEVAGPADDFEIKIPTFGTISDQAPDQATPPRL